MTGIARRPIARRPSSFASHPGLPGILSVTSDSSRVRIDGVHLTCDDRPFRVRGVTYGSFLSRRSDGAQFPEPAVIRRDFAAIAATGLNVVRIYTTPPVDLLDAAREAGLRLLVGIHYDDWRMLPPPGRKGNRQVLEAGRRAVAEAMERCAGRPEVLAIAVGNEVPADLIRLYGVRSVEAVLSALIEEVHHADPGMLATYVNFPTTEFLEVAGQDLVCFNVFLERPADWRAYLRHLQIVAGERPVIITECGLASEVHGESCQAEALEWQLRAADETGVGVTVFSWTDEWGVGGQPVTGWGFGMTTEDRRLKPATQVLRRWAARSLRETRPLWPTISVVVCAYNEEARIGACLESLTRCDYPDLEIIVCDDGSSDRTAEIARRFPFKLLELPRGGLSKARNAGLRAASGAIIAYLDGDAQCHPDWPYYLAMSFDEPKVVATGGPNVEVPEVDFAERVVDACPGGPIHVLLSDDRAEHVPGCNMAIQREALLSVGGFDEVFRSAGDDVDVCWKLQDRGGQVGFAPTAQVRHHRRATFKGYLRQQYNYGRSERMVAGRHPHRFNRLGQARWHGFIYGGQRILPSLLRPVIYHGIAGEAPFQTTRRRSSEIALSWITALLPLLAIPALVGLGIGPWHPSGFVVAGAILGALVGVAVLVALASRPPRNEPRPIAFRIMVGLLHVAQPIIRAWGRVRGPRLAPTNGNGKHAWAGNRSIWIRDLRRELSGKGFRVRFGSAGAEWDLETTGFLTAVRVRCAVAWGWIPVHRLASYTRLPLYLVIGAALALAAFDPISGALAFAALIGVAVVETWHLRRAVHRAVQVTTGGVPGRPAR